MRSFVNSPAASKIRRALPSVDDQGGVQLPLPPGVYSDMYFEMEVYARFMRTLREGSEVRPEARIRTSIELTAECISHGDALVAKLLVDLGLRAPRTAFPPSYLEFVDRVLSRNGWDMMQGAPKAVLELARFWQEMKTRPRPLRLMDAQSPMPIRN